MNTPRPKSWRRLARKRGMVAAGEMLSGAALLACFAGPIAVAARSIGPQLASDMDQRIHQISAQQPGGSGPASQQGDGSLDFGGAENDGPGERPRTPRAPLTGRTPTLVGQQ